MNIENHATELFNSIKDFLPTDKFDLIMSRIKTAMIVMTNTFQSNDSIKQEHKRIFNSIKDTYTFEEEIEETIKNIIFKE